MDRFQGMVNNEVRKWSSAPVPKSAISGAANRQLVKAFHAYDPDKGAMNTFIHYYLRKTSAVVYKYQNLGRIPSHRIRKISDFKNARDFLEETLDRPPSAVEIAEELSWSLSEVSRMESELRRDLIASKNFETDSMAELAHEASEEKSALRSVYYELDTVERLVFEYTLGVHGKPEISAGDIARKLHISAPKVSRIRSKIDTKLRERGI
jgi:RNA polymerase primary sigma factor